MDGWARSPLTDDYGSSSPTSALYKVSLRQSRGARSSAVPPPDVNRLSKVPCEITRCALRETPFSRSKDRCDYLPGGASMDKDGKQKSNLGNDKNLNTEKNPVTGVKTTEPQSNKDNSETDENESGTSGTTSQRRRRMAPGNRAI
jgi:hypothetical protein